MSWMQKLYETYQQGVCLDIVEEQKPIPICHTIQNVHINIVIDEKGDFKRAKVLEKTQIVLPSTEKSAGRSNGESPHPLADRIQYVAGDYARYGGLKPPYFKGYKEQLEKWCVSEFKHPGANAVYEYISKETIVEDLINSQVLWVDKYNVLLIQWPENMRIDVPLLFKLLPKKRGILDQGNALVCWTVEKQGVNLVDTWKDAELQKSWIGFCNSTFKLEGLCCIAGDIQAIASSHPAKLRHSGDKAKLISSNDSKGYTFRGRFTDSLQAVVVGSIISQKAHNALRWLINRQGYRNDDQVVVAWAVSGKSIPEAVKQIEFDLDNFEEVEIDQDSQDDFLKKDLTVDCGQSFARQLKKYMKGYKARLQPNEAVIIMGIDSVTTGRMGITYYREYFAHEYIDMITRWQDDFAWFQRVEKKILHKKGKVKTIVSWPVCAPSLWTIVSAVYGDIIKSNKTLKKNIIERLIPCIVEAKSFPLDIVNVAIRKASKPLSGEKWEWERNVGVACALYRGFYKRHSDKNKRRNYSMALDVIYNNRDYLYGRLLAVAEGVEKYSLYLSDEKRLSTAIRMMQRFADRPFSTWRTVELALQPYIQRLQNRHGGFVYKQLSLLDEIMELFKKEDFSNDKPLSGEFLLGFHSQRLELRKKREKEEIVKQEDIEEGE